jgi:hypothetical protein
MWMLVRLNAQVAPVITTMVCHFAVSNTGTSLTSAFVSLKLEVLTTAQSVLVLEIS